MTNQRNGYQQPEDPALHEIGGPMQRSGRMRWMAGSLLVLLLLLTMGFYVRNTLSNRCQVDAVEDAASLLLHQLGRFDHDYQFATSASQTSLIRPVNSLQQILMDTQQVPVPTCLQAAKEELVSYMGAVIRAFQAYGAQEVDVTIRDLIDQSDAHYGNFYLELEAVEKCAPFCIR